MIESFGRFVSLLLLSVLVLCSGPSCLSDQEVGVIDPEQANLLLIGAYTIHDFQCGSRHSLIYPLTFPVDQKEFEFCIGQVFTVDCAVWNSADDPTPLSCKSLLIEI